MEDINYLGVEELKKRPSIEEYFLKMAELVSTRSTCRMSVGAVLTHNGNVIATGYNGAPIGAAHCLEEGCLMEDGHCTRVVHAEINTIAQAAKYGHSTDGAVLYATLAPCIRCTNILINAGVKKIVCREINPDYTDENVKNALRKALVSLVQKWNEEADLIYVL